MQQSVKEYPAGQISDDGLRDIVCSVIDLLQTTSHRPKHHMDDRVHLQRRGGKIRPYLAGVLKQPLEDFLVSQFFNPFSLEMAYDNSPPIMLFPI